MACTRKPFFILVLLLVCFNPSLEARKLGRMEKTNVFLKHSPVKTAIPKRTSSTFSQTAKGHATVINERPFSRYPAKNDRNLQSVPSPGVGH